MDLAILSRKEIGKRGWSHGDFSNLKRKEDVCKYNIGRDSDRYYMYIQRVKMIKTIQSIITHSITHYTIAQCINTRNCCSPPSSTTPPIIAS